MKRKLLKILGLSFLIMAFLLSTFYMGFGGSHKETQTQFNVWSQEQYSQQSFAQKAYMGVLRFMARWAGSPALASSTPDWITDGFQDDVQIQAALTVAGQAGMIFCVGDNFSISAPIYPTAESQTLQGRGRGGDDFGGGTTLYEANAANLNAIIQKNAGTTIHLFTITDLTINGNKANNPTGKYGVDVSGVGLTANRIFVTQTKSHGWYGDKTGEAGADTWVSIRQSDAHLSGGNGFNLQNFPFASYFQDIVTDANVGDGFYTVNMSGIEAVRINAGANGGYGFHFKSVDISQVTHLYDEGNAFGSWLEDCQQFVVNGFTSSSSATNAAYQPLKLTGTVLTAKGNAVDVNNLLIFSATQTKGIVMDGMWNGRINGSITLQAAGAIGVTWSNTQQERLDLTMYLPGGGGASYDSATAVYYSDLRVNNSTRNGIGVRVRNNAAESINNTSWTAITFNTEDYDTDTMHSTTANTSKIFFTHAGYYMIGGSVTWASNNTGDRQISIQKNGAATYYASDSRMTVTTGIETSQSVNTIYYFSPGDYIELIVWQSCGAALNVNSNSWYSPVFWAQKVDAAFTY